MLILQKPRNPDAYEQATSEEDIRRLVGEGYSLMYLDLTTRVYYFRKLVNSDAEESFDGGN